MLHVGVIAARLTREQLTDLVQLMEEIDPALCPYYVVEFGTAAIGMSIASAVSETGHNIVTVTDLRCDSAGRPMSALACGRITVGDYVLAVNDANLTQHNNLTAIADEFRCVHQLQMLCG